MDFYTLKQASEKLQMSKRTVQRRMKRLNLSCEIGRPRLTEDQLKKLGGVK